MLIPWQICHLCPATLLHMHSLIAHLLLVRCVHHFLITSCSHLINHILFYTNTHTHSKCIGIECILSLSLLLLLLHSDHAILYLVWLCHNTIYGQSNAAQICISHYLGIIHTFQQLLAVAAASTFPFSKAFIPHENKMRNTKKINRFEYWALILFLFILFYEKSTSETDSA